MMHDIVLPLAMSRRGDTRYKSMLLLFLPRQLLILDNASMLPRHHLHSTPLFQQQQQSIVSSSQEDTMPNKYSYAHVLSQLESQGRLDPNHRSHSKYQETWYDSGPDSPRSGSVDTSSSSSRSDPAAAPPSLSHSQSSPDNESLYSVESTDSRTADSIVTQIYAPEHPSTPPATEHAPIRSPPLRPFPNYTRRDSTPQYIGRSPASSGPYSPSHSRPSLSQTTTTSAPSRLPPRTEHTSLSPSTSRIPTKTYAESTFSDDSYFANDLYTGSLTSPKSSLKTDTASNYTSDSYFATVSLPGTLTPLSAEFDSRVNPWDDVHYLPSTFRMHPPSDDASSTHQSIAPSSISRASTPDSAAPPPIARNRPSDYPPGQSPNRPSSKPYTLGSKDSTPRSHHRLPFLKSSHHKSSPPPFAPSTSTFVASLPPTSSSTAASSRNWVASTFSVEGMSEKEIEKLRRKGINPALRAEMQAARKGRGGLPVSVGNTFIG